ncbi:hypothetical protein GQ53DRAFT_665329 [Thozetella sp. PMI_491]|nr:hypothetical protein GQ53DRAFT_665329 [Thozetella sp. PMI_491]
MERPFPLGLPNNPRPARLNSVAREPPRASPETSASAAVVQNGTSATTPIAPEQVVKLTREAMSKALANEANRASEAEANAIQGDTLTLRPGVTIDLRRQAIPLLPEEVVDIIKDKLERLALNHNSISSFPARFAECTALRHVAARNNALEAFPLPLCELKQLEYLDLGLNKIKVLPQEIANLTSLKAFAIDENQLEDLPESMGDMASLVRLNVDNNPIDFPPDILLEPPPVGSEEFEAMEIKTTRIKNFLRQRTNPTTEVSGEASTEGVETPRITAPATRRLSSRFPVKVKGGSVPDLRSPAERMPSVPSKSHYRGMSQTSNSSRKPGVIPLTIGQADGRTQAGLDTDKPLPEEPPARRFPRRMVSSPDEPSLQRPLYVRQLSSVPIRRGGLKSPEHVSDVAKGILYSIFQVHLPIQTLMGLTNDGTTRRSSLEMVFYNTNVYLQELDQAIKEGNDVQNSLGIQRAYVTLINAYLHVCSRLATNVDVLVDNGDRRYIRTFLMSLYHTIMELRVVASNHFPSEAEQTRIQVSKPLPSSIGPGVRAMPAASLARYEPSNPYKQPSEMGMGAQRYSPYRLGTNAVARTPRSAASFTSSILSNPEDGVGLEEADVLFGRFLTSIEETTDLVLIILPTLNAKFRADLREARADITRTAPISSWEQLVARCANAIQQGELLRSQLGDVSASPPSGATPEFWSLCSALFNAWAEFGNHLAQSLDLELIGAQTDARDGIRRIARSMKESVHLMVMCRRAGVGAGETSLGFRQAAFGDPNVTTGRPEFVQMTPQGAALGPAVQATIQLL